jgi:hypothetical protein
VRPFASRISASSFLLEVWHQTQLVAFDRDLSRRHFSLALRGQVTARAHRQRIGKRAGDARDDDDVRLDGGANDAGDEAEVAVKPSLNP